MTTQLENPQKASLVSDVALRASTGFEIRADRILKVAARSWFVVAAIGLWIFASYVALLPKIRARFPAFHRWNGRVFLSGACLASLAGLYLVWIRGGSSGDLWQHLGITLDAILILAFAAIALRYAMARKIAIHRRWALRLFLVVNAVWFFRIGLMFWLFIHQAPVGFDPQTFTGPFLIFLAFAQTLLPLAILETYLRVKDGAGVAGKLAMASGLVVVTAAMGVGIFAATMGLWLPQL